MAIIDHFLDPEMGKNFPQGSVIFKEGDESKEMYVIIEGEVKILKRGKRLVVLEGGHIFGEMALVDDSPRSASAVAKTDCKVVPIDEKEFSTMIQKTPIFALQVMRVMADRLRTTTDSVI